MEGIFLEFENENALRAYPFASGRVPSKDSVERPDGLFVDAALYPVNPIGVLYLSSVSEDGEFVVSDSGTGDEIMSGKANGTVIELFDKTPLSRHSGDIVAVSGEAIEAFLGAGLPLEYSPQETPFAAGCVFPVAIDGVVSMSVGSDKADIVAGGLAFSNGDTDEVRVSSATRADGRQTIRFDVLPRLNPPDDFFIRRIICVVDGKTPFRIAKLSYNTVMLRLHDIDKEAVCSAAHREDAYQMADTCSCEDAPCDKDVPGEDPLPYTYQLEEVFIPPGS